MSAPSPLGPAGSTRQSARKQSQTQGKSTVEEDRDSESVLTIALQEQIAQLQAEVARLSQERSAEPEQPIPTTESPPKTSQQSAATPSVRFQSETPAPTRVKLSERTPNIDCLTDGKQPTFRQWQASITDRLEINADHYRSERARMALVWGHTSSTAMEYLEPQYLADSDLQRFQSAEEMISLLRSFFLSGNE